MVQWHAGPLLFRPFSYWLMSYFFSAWTSCLSHCAARYLRERLLADFPALCLELGEPPDSRLVELHFLPASPFHDLKTNGKMPASYFSCFFKAAASSAKLMRRRFFVTLVPVGPSVPPEPNSLVLAVIVGKNRASDLNRCSEPAPRRPRLTLMATTTFGQSTIHRPR